MKAVDPRMTAIYEDREELTVTDLICDVCGMRIINRDRSWPRASEVPLPVVRNRGRVVKNAHLGCYRLAREYGRPITDIGTRR